jgi:hypothetical protein
MWWPRPTCRTSAYAYSLLGGRTGVGAEDEAPVVDPCACYWGVAADSRSPLVPLPLWIDTCANQTPSCNLTLAAPHLRALTPGV